MRVEIWSDIVCPWCYIGKRRFEGALARFEHREGVEVVWRSFELDPRTPAEVEGDLATRLAAKYGMSREQALAANARVTALAAAEGLAYDLAGARPGNTFDGHRLIHLAAQFGVQDAAKERLMKSYFCEGGRPSDPDALVRLLSEVGVDPDHTRGVLASDAFAAEVRADEAEAARLGINGVPFFVLDRRYGVSGAQSPETLLEALSQAWDEAQPTAMRRLAGGPEGAVCEDGSCAV